MDPIGMTTNIETEIKAAEQQRCAAMIANDPAALAAILDDDLQFHHATGAVDDKSAFLAKMAAGRIRYAGIAWSEEKVTALAGDAAMLTGRMATDVQVEGTDKRLNNRVMTVWRKSDGAWRLLAFQSTPIAG
jgi:ketosteroid isomerase-like protein